MILRVIRICAAVALVAIGIAETFHLAQTTPPARIDVPGELPPDPVMRAEARFAPVRSALGARGITGHIGYFSDVPSRQLNSTPHGIERYFSAQFSLAPWILDVDGPDPWIVTDFAGEAAAAPTRLPPGYELIADFGHGVRLLHYRS